MSQKQIVVLDETNPMRAAAVCKMLGEGSTRISDILALQEFLAQYDKREVLIIIGAGIKKWTDGFKLAETLQNEGRSVIIFSFRNPAELGIQCPHVLFDWNNQPGSYQALQTFVSQWLA